MLKEGPNQLRVALDPPNLAAHHAQELLGRVGAVVAQVVVFELAVERFDRVELGRVGGQPVRLDSVAVLVQEVLDLLLAVDGAVVPDQQDPSSDVSQKLLEKTDDAVAVVGSELHLEVEFAGGCDGGDGAHLVPVSLVLQDRGLADGSPRLAHEGNDAEPGLVEEKHYCAEPGRPFFRRGHSSRIHRAISSSSRSLPRVTGFCQDKPS